MKFFGVFRKSAPAPESLPGFIREAEDVRGVRILRFQGNVGKEIGAEVADRNKAVENTPHLFDRPLLLNFAGTTGADFSTVSYIVQAVRVRMASSAKVGLIHPSPELVAELEMAKLGSLFIVFESEEEALAALGSS